MSAVPQILIKNKPVKAFKPTSADYDARIFAFREKDWTVSLTLVGGREHIPIATSNYQIGKLKGTKPTSAQLCKHRDGNYYVHIQLGVDFGRTDIAVTKPFGLKSKVKSHAFKS